jgi:hypothetical protein
VHRYTIDVDAIVVELIEHTLSVSPIEPVDPVFCKAAEIACTDAVELVVVIKIPRPSGCAQAPLKVRQCVLWDVDDKAIK